MIQFCKFLKKSLSAFKYNSKHVLSVYSMTQHISLTVSINSFDSLKNSVG